MAPQQSSSSRHSKPTLDCLLLPTAGTIYAIYAIAAVNADPVKLNDNLGLYTNFANLLDLAVLALPAGFRRNGLPFGISLLAPAFADHALLDLGADFQRLSAYPSGNSEG